MTWFTLNFKGPDADVMQNATEDEKYLYDRMYNWITFQYFYTYFSVIFMFMITWMYRKMDIEAKGLDLKTPVNEPK